MTGHTSFDMSPDRTFAPAGALHSQPGQVLRMEGNEADMLCTRAHLLGCQAAAETPRHTPADLYQPA